MLQWIFKKLKNNSKGFTLVELVVVIAILGILAGIAVPKFGASRKRAAIIAHNANVRTLMSAATMYIADKGEISEAEWTANGGTKADDQDWAPYLQEWPTIPKGISDKLEKENDDYYGNDYKVIFEADGNITVVPTIIQEQDTHPDS